MGSCIHSKMSEIEHQISGSDDSSDDIGSGSGSSDSSSGSESESMSEGENVPMTRINSKKLKTKKGLIDQSKASEMFTKMLEKNNKNINNTNKQTLGSSLGNNSPISTKNVLIQSAKRGMENLQLAFKRSESEIRNRIKTIPDVSGRFVEKIQFGSIFALLLRLLLIPVIFGSIFVSSYLVSDKIENYLNPESDIQELHFFLTSKQEDVRYPRRPEMIASVSSIILTPIVAQFINKFI